MAQEEGFLDPVILGQSSEAEPIIVESDEEIAANSMELAPVDLSDIRLATATGEDGTEYTVNVVDGDTTVLTDPEGNETITRDPAVNTGELPKISGGAFSPGSLTGQVHSDYVADKINSGEFSNVVSTGEKGHFGRALIEFQNDQGISLGDHLISERIVDPNKYTTRDQMFARSADQLADDINFYGSAADDAQKARNLVNQAVFDFRGDVATLTLAPSKEEYDNYEYWRSHTGINHLKDTVKQAEAAAQQEGLTEEQQLLADDNLAKSKEQLQSWLLAPPVYFGYQGDGGTVHHSQKGFWDEVTDSFWAGMYELQGMSADFTQLSGDITNIDSLEDYGEAWSNDNLQDIMRYGEGNVGLSDVKGLGTGLQFFANTLARYGPQLGVLYGFQWGGAVVGGAAGTLVGGPAGTVVGAAAGRTAGTLAGAYLMSAAGFYGEMPDGEKDPYLALSYAVPMALVERYGLDNLSILGRGVSGGRALKPEAYEEVVEAVSTKLDIPIEAARKRLDNDVHEILGAAGLELKDYANRSLVNRQTLRDVITNTAKAVGIEGATEAIQEAIQYGGIAAHTSVEFDTEQLLSRLAESAIVGSIAASPFGAHSALGQQALVNTVVYENDPNAPNRSWFRPPAGWKHSDAVEAKFDGQITTEEAIARTRKEEVTGYVKSDGFNTTLKDLQDEKAAGYWQATKDLIRNPLAALNSFRWNIVKDDIETQGRVDADVAAISAILGDTSGFVGNSIFQTVKRYYGKYMVGISPTADLITKANVESEADLQSLRTQDPNTLTPDQRTVVDQMRKEENDMMAKIIADMKARGIELDAEREEFLRDNFIEKSFVIDPTKADEEFVNKLAETIIPGTKEKLGEVDAKNLVNKLQANPYDPAVLDTFDILGIQQSPEFNQYKAGGSHRQKLMLMATSYANRNAKSGVEEFFVKRLMSSNMSDERRAKMAAKLKQYLDMVDGKFGQIESKLVSDIQQFPLSMSQFAYMDTNFFANMTDVVYGMMRIKNKAEAKKYFSAFGKAFFRGVWTDLHNVSSKTTGGAISRKDKWEDNKDLQRLRLLGHIGETSEVLQIEGAVTSGKVSNRLATILFKANLVEAYTDGSKAAVGATSWDEILQLVADVVEHRKRGNTSSQGYLSTLRRLKKYGVPVDRLVELHVESETLPNNQLAEDYILQMDDPDSPFYQEIMNIYQVANINYVDEFTPRPEPGSGAKILEQRHLALFTQYKRFISHFTSNIIPNLWNQYLSQGSPQVTYQVFNRVIFTFGMAYVGQALKDALKYGWGEEAPYLDEWDEDLWDSSLGRGIKYTGWVGTPEIALESILKYREDQWKSHPERMLELLLGQSAALNTGWQISQAKDPWRTIKGKTPWLGDIKAAREHLLNI